MTKAKAQNDASTVVSHCTFVGVQFDAKAVGAIETIAAGLVENAKALGLLAQVLKASNVNIETMLRFDTQKV